MRSALAIMLVASCGPPQVCPPYPAACGNGRPAPIVDDDPEPAPLARPADAPTFVDAGIDAYEPRLKVTIGFIDADPVETPEATALIDGSTNALSKEDSIDVMTVDFRVWCASVGKFEAFCFEDKRRCAKLAKSCHEQTAWACYSFAERTSGEKIVRCLDTYGHCAMARTITEDDPETRVVSPCVIGRARTK